jgi:hypothetical protein
MLIKEIVKVTSGLKSQTESYEIQDIKDYIAFNGERALTNSFVLKVLGKVMGKTLTIIDASVIDKQQNKSMKDLLRNVFSDAMELTSEFGFDQKIMTKIAEEQCPENIDELDCVSVEEALGVETR